MSNNFIHYIKPTLQNPENLSESHFPHGITDFLKLGSDIDVVANIITNIANE